MQDTTKILASFRVIKKNSNLPFMPFLLQTTGPDFGAPSYTVYLLPEFDGNAYSPDFERTVILPERGLVIPHPFQAFDVQANIWRNRDFHRLKDDHSPSKQQRDRVCAFQKTST